MAEVIFFHLGLHKTATSWLQRQLFPRLPLPVYRTRQFDKIDRLVADDLHRAIIVSHEGLGGSITDSKRQGDSLATFVSALDRINELRCGRKLLIGFREHRSWINSAYSQRLKKTRISSFDYKGSYSLDDLLWMRRVEQCDWHGLEGFFFLYEELASDPMALLTDICGFLATPLPPQADELLMRRENISPKSERGFRAARRVYGLARLLGSLPFIDGKKLRQRGIEWASRFDDAKTAHASITFTPPEAEILQEDWRRLVSLVSARRGRDFSAFSSRL